MSKNTTLNRDMGNWEPEGIYVDNGCFIYPQIIIQNNLNRFTCDFCYHFR